MLPQGHACQEEKNRGIKQKEKLDLKAGLVIGHGWTEELICSQFGFLLDVVFVGKDDYSSGVTCLHKTFDYLIKLSRGWLTWNLYGLSDTHTPLQRDRQAHLDK